MSKFPAAIGITSPKTGPQKLRIAVPDDVAMEIRKHACTDTPKFKLLAITEAEALFTIHDASDFEGKKVTGVSSLSVAPACKFPNQIVVHCKAARLFPDGFRFDPNYPQTMELFGDKLSVEIPLPGRRKPAGKRGKKVRQPVTARVKAPEPKPEPSTVLFLTEQGGTFDVPQDVAKLVFNLLGPFKRED